MLHHQFAMMHILGRLLPDRLDSGAQTVSLIDQAVQVQQGVQRREQ